MKVLFFLAFFSTEAFCAQYTSYMQFMPDNELHLFDRIDQASNVNEEDFDRVIDEISKLYSPIVKSHHANLVVAKSWDDPTVNAYANRSGRIWYIHMFGGLARRQEITVDGFQLVACHEMGHHLAGFPFNSWASNEGNSDYFSALSCARSLWRNDKAKNALAAKKIHAYPKKFCDEAWKLKDDIYLCYRIALAGKSLADLLSRSTAKFETPDKRIVLATSNAHPAGQCRLDTYLSAAVCKANFDPRVLVKTELEAKKYSCFEDEGQRPKCWFRAAI